jgi:hypothetical protein
VQATQLQVISFILIFIGIITLAITLNQLGTNVTNAMTAFSASQNSMALVLRELMNISKSSTPIPVT